MVLDEPREADDVYQLNGFTMMIDKELHKTTKDVTIDYVVYGMGSGFRFSLARCLRQLPKERPHVKTRRCEWPVGFL